METMPRKARTYTSDVFRLAPCLTSDELLVLLALVDYGDRIFPSQTALAAKTRLHVSTVKRVLASLRTKELVRSLGSGKALTYHLDLAQRERGTSLSVSEVGRSQGARCSLRESEVVAQRERGILTRELTTQTNQGAATAAAGVVELSQDIRSAIARRDPRGDVDAQHRVVTRLLGEHGVSGAVAADAWIALARNWARTGNGAYETLSELLAGMVDVRDPSAVLMYRIRRLAA